MFESLIIFAFCLILFVSLSLKLPLVLALLLGMALFWFYGWRKHFTIKELFLMTAQSSLKARNVVVILALIGAMTGLWRASGTIAYIVSMAAGFFLPSAILVTIFLANSGVSFLIGTSFGTAASMGTICMTIANVMGISPVLAGGAVISGCFFGDRCSPLSSSAALVASVTDTDLYGNIRNMMKTGALPFGLSIVIYGILGLVSKPIAAYEGALSIFSDAFHLNAWCFLPALLVLVLALCRVPVQFNIGASIFLSFLLGFWLQGIELLELCKICIWGFHPQDPALATLAGGGFSSMANVILVVIVASGYAGIFEKTGMLDPLSAYIGKLSERITPFGAVVIVSILSCALACNQSLPTILLPQLCKESVPDKEKLALYMENSVIVIAPLIPWSIAITVPTATIGAPISCILAACFLYLLPICQFLSAMFTDTNRFKNT